MSDRAHQASTTLDRRVGSSNLGSADTVYSGDPLAKTKTGDADLLGPSTGYSPVELVGRVIACRYKVLKLLGAGGMGAVYLARDHELDDLVAVKMLRDSVAATTGAVEFLRHEVRLARRVTHRNVARIFELGEFDAGRFLTMEYIDGDSLSALIQQNDRISLDRSAEILVDVCHGLHAVHEAGIVHRDIKPDNIMVSLSGRVVLSDFGIALSSRSVASDASLSTVRAGTPAYMAPEQLLGEEVTTRSDVFSLGVTAFEMLTGSLPWHLLKDTHDRLTEPPPDPRHAVADIPAGIARLLMRALAQRPEERVSSPSAFSKELSAIITSVHDSRRRVSGFTSTPSQRSGKRSVAVLPFRNRGRVEDEYLSSGFTEDLIDCLSGITALRVLSRGATARFVDDARESHEIGRELSVHVVIEGSVQRMGDAIQIKVRAIESEDGVQSWSKRYRVSPEELLTTSDEVAEALAESLSPAAEQADGATLDSGRSQNVRPSALPSAAAMELYLQARASYRGFASVAETLRLFEQALALAPNSPMINAGYAMALMRVSMYDRDDGQELAHLARQAAERAATTAPDMGEPHMALGLLGLHNGDVVSAVSELRTTISLAPSMASAHGFLGEIFAEMNRLPESMRRLETSESLDPTSGHANHTRRRTAALLGDWDRFYELSQKTPPAQTPMGLYLYMRVAAFRRDAPQLQDVYDQLTAIPSDPYDLKTGMHAQIDVFLGRRPASELYPIITPTFFPRRTSRRGHVNRLQFLAELSGFAGDVDICLNAIEDADNHGMFDLLWLDYCPLLRDVRAHKRYPSIRGRVQERVHAGYDAFWR